MLSFLDLACFTSQTVHFLVELILSHQNMIDRESKTALIIFTALYYSMSIYIRDNCMQRVCFRIPDSKYGINGRITFQHKL